MGGSESDSFGSDLLPFAHAPTEDVPSGPFTGTSRFRLIRPLGEGSFGTVYEVHDVEQDRPVALKLLRRVTPSWLYRFKREFRSLAGVRHQNLVRLDELSASGDHAFFTMELVHGVPLDRYLVDRRYEMVDVYRQLAEGVHALHGAGLLHRDIKPSNVLVERGGRVVLLDFGLAIPRDRLTTQLAGTPAYMAPELWNGLPASEASDWFAVGAMLYESLTGTSGIDFGQTRESGVAEAPIARVSEMVAGEPLAMLCDALLDRDPSRRPSGSAVLEHMGTAPPPSTTDPEHFVGRRKELDALHQALDDCAGSRAPLLAFIEGPSGVGKSALLRRFAEELAVRAPQTLLLRGACHERESVPYKALDGVIDELSRALCHMPRVDVERCMPRGAGSLGRLFPVLRQVEAVRRLDDGSGVPREELRRRGGAALRELFVRLGDRRRIVMIVDDVEWGDADSAALLFQLIHGPDAPPIAFVATSSGHADGFLREMKRQRELLSSVTELKMTLSGLSPGEAGELVARLRPDAPPDVCARTVREAGDNVMFLVELARYGAASGIDALLAERLGKLSAPARACLELLALAGHALPLRVVRALADPTHAVTLEADRLVRTRTSEGELRLECHHARVARAALAGIDPDCLRRMHADLAEALASLCPDDPERIAHHLAAAGDQRRAHAELLRAAEKAAAAGAHELAASLFERALSLLSTEERNGASGSAVYARLAEVLSLSGFGKRAAETCLLAARHASPARSRELRALAAQELLAGGYMDEGRRLFLRGRGRPRHEAAPHDTGHDGENRLERAPAPPHRLSLQAPPRARGPRDRPRAYRRAPRRGRGRVGRRPGARLHAPGRAPLARARGR